jgi:hypothetical protein
MLANTNLETRDARRDGVAENRQAGTIKVPTIRISWRFLSGGRAIVPGHDGTHLAERASHRSRARSLDLAARTSSMEPRRDWQEVVTCIRVDSL